MKKSIFILSLFFCVFYFAQANQEPIKNAGFVPSNIWYSKTPFFDGESIRIYTILFNGSSYDMNGAVEFLDKANGDQKVVGKVDFSIPSGGRIRDIWIDWKATEGKHIITARIINSSISLADGTRQIVAIENAETGKSEVLTDFDTDADGVGNTIDADDDNDGVPDIDELKNGTNPLKSDSNGNGISDKKEIEDLAKKIEKNKEKEFEKISNVIKATTDNIPEPIKNTTMATVRAVEAFRSMLGDKMRIAKENKLSEIKKNKEKTNGTTLNNNKQEVVSDKTVSNAILSAPKKPFAYASLAAVAMLQYFFDWKFVFYGVDFYILYRLMFLIARRIFHRK
ncbi:MAG: hypothetical protein AAB924_01410 [Patescibacteria group bacterium]